MKKGGGGIMSKHRSCACLTGNKKPIEIKGELYFLCPRCAALNKSIAEWYKENYPLGKALGYPDCCINAFCNDSPEALKVKKRNGTERIRYDASFINGQYTGFIPCVHHAKQIVNGEITLQSLIKNRDNNFPPFPNHAPINIKYKP